MFTFCKKEVTDPDDTNNVIESQNKRLARVMSYNDMDILTNGKIYEYDTLDKLSRIIYLSEAELIDSYEEFEYNLIDTFNIIIGSTTYDADKNVTSTIVNGYLLQNDTVLLEEKVVLGEGGFYYLERFYFEYTINNKIYRSAYAPNPNHEPQWDSVFTYGPNGLKSSFTYSTYASGGVLSSWEKHRFDYNEENEIEKELITKSGNASPEELYYKYEYTTNGRVSKCTIKDGNGIPVSVDEYSYNSFENSIKISHFSGGGDLKHIKKHTYDSDQNLIEEHYKIISPSGGYTKKYTYETY